MSSPNSPPPSIGIAMAVYRPPSEFFIPQLRTIQDQSFRDWLCVMTWDSPLQDFPGPEALTPFRADPRFIWIQNERSLGHRRNFEKAIQEAAGRGVQAVACSDQDDLWDQDKLERLWERWIQLPPLSLLHSDLRILKDGRILKETAWQTERRNRSHHRPHHLLIRNQVTGCSMIFDASLAKRYPEIPDEVEFHDHWYALAASCHGGVHALEQPLISYRQHENNVVGVAQAEELLRRPGSRTLAALLENSRISFVQSRDLARAARARGMPLSWPSRWLFEGPWDLGLSLLALALMTLLTEPNLARQALKRALGKGVELRGG